MLVVAGAVAAISGAVAERVAPGARTAAAGTGSPVRS
jgi:hypothetical protein